MFATSISSPPPPPPSLHPPHCHEPLCWVTAPQQNNVSSVAMVISHYCTSLGRNMSLPLPSDCYNTDELNRVTVRPVITDINLKYIIITFIWYLRIDYCLIYTHLVGSEISSSCIQSDHHSFAFPDIVIVFYKNTSCWHSKQRWDL